MLKFIKSFLFVIASIIVALCLVFIPNQAGTVSVVFISVLSIYLGVDIADTIVKSAKMGKGDYKPIHKHKYIVSSVCLVGLIITSSIVGKTHNVDSAMASFISSCLATIGMLIGALEGNKIAANHDGEH